MNLRNFLSAFSFTNIVHIADSSSHTNYVYFPFEQQDEGSKQWFCAVGDWQENGDCVCFTAMGNKKQRRWMENSFMKIFLNKLFGVVVCEI